MSEFNDGINAVIEAMQAIWGVTPDREEGTYAMQPDPYPIVTAAAVPGTAYGTIQVSQAGAFVLVKHAVYVSTRDVRIGWSSGGSDRRWTSDANGGHVECIGGEDTFPFIYPKAYVLDAATTISMQIVNTVATARSVYWDLIGWRIWNVQALNLTRRAVG